MNIKNKIHMTYSLSGWAILKQRGCSLAVALTAIICQFGSSQVDTEQQPTVRH